MVGLQTALQALGSLGHFEDFLAMVLESAAAGAQPWLFHFQIHGAQQQSHGGMGPAAGVGGQERQAEQVGRCRQGIDLSRENRIQQGHRQHTGQQPGAHQLQIDAVGKDAEPAAEGGIQAIQAVEQRQGIPGELARCPGGITRENLHCLSEIFLHRRLLAWQGEILRRKR